jgi:Domain of unknown function (DUF2405)
MNDFDAWQKILVEWKQVNQMKRYNQELYDQLGGTKMYVLIYAERNNFALPNKDALYRIIDSIHDTISKVKHLQTEIKSTSDDLNS